MEDKERIEAVLNYSKLNNGTFSAKVGMNPATLSQILGGRVKPTLNVLRPIADAFPEINPGWLFMGQGEMLLSDSQSTTLSGAAPSDASSKASDSTPIYNVTPEPDLFSGLNRQMTSSSPRQQPQPAPQVNVADIVNGVVGELKKPQRKVIEVRIFFDDGTYESFSSR